MVTKLEDSILKTLRVQSQINAKLARGLMELSEVMKERDKEKPMPLLDRVSDILTSLENQLELIQAMNEAAEQDGEGSGER